YVLPLKDVTFEHADAVGEKMGRLGEIRSRLGCRVPEGFVVTTRACRAFLDAAGLGDEVEALREHVASGQEGFEASARELRERVLQSPLPRSLRRVLRTEVDRLMEEGTPSLFAVRSSATGEDDELSFAGQYSTFLGVPAGGVEDAYRKVVASLFSPEVIRYQQRNGMSPGCGLMAVGCLRMVSARASGVVYTLDPAAAAPDVQVVSAAWGLGKIVVEGEAPVDRFEVRREPGYEVVTSRIADKRWRYRLAPNGGIERDAVRKAYRRMPAMPEARISELAEVACRIERHMKAAQDIEWALDDKRRLFILQARPLTIPPGLDSDHGGLADVVARYPVLLEGRGEVACRGIGTGRVHVVHDGDGIPDEVPTGSVLVTRAATPRLSGILSGVSAVITDLGTSTGHFAAVARDYRVPTVVATGIATQRLQEGMEVTVDAEENVVYEGRIDELVRYQLLRRFPFQDAMEFRLLKRILRKIAPLRLRDPLSPAFLASRCHSYHDIIRFAHEKAVAELTEIGWLKPSRSGRQVCRLELPIPLDLILLDLGGGFRPPSPGSAATLEDVTSRPLAALLETLTTTTAWETGPAAMDLDGFMSSATRSMSLSGPMAARPQQNLAIASEEYLHLSLRLGYHFNIVDTYLTGTPRDNYIYFRFAGGVTELIRRSRRTALLRRILERHGFIVETSGDLLIGRIKGLAPDAMVERLGMVGRLIGVTRQLDIFLRTDKLVDECVERFMSGAPLRPDNPAHGGPREAS
ncbi:MAG TPA: PEP/pyruvate-binding domain-containing protein, partial [Longimicrobiales bacterium]|nr:PEP/pyruvate-binding domain-containing protein [Longimicrobiales bacterium]